MTDSKCYAKANVDRKLFSRIQSEPGYKTSKTTSCAFALALELFLPDAKDLIAKAGYSLSRSSKFNLVVECCLLKRYYDVHRINAILANLNLQFWVLQGRLARQHNCLMVFIKQVHMSSRFGFLRRCLNQFL